MRGTAVQFGAGNIGRGFIAQLCVESGLDVVFVDVAPDTLEALNAEHGYTIHVVGPEPSEVRIEGVRGVDGRNREEVAVAVAESAIVSTAVGAAALSHIAPALAAGLSLRRKMGGGPLNILICENLHDAGSALRTLVAGCLDSAERADVLANTGFVQAVVSRMVPLQEHDEVVTGVRDIRVEAYKRLPIDSRATVGTLPDIRGIEPVENFTAYVERKLYTHNCAHATIGYLGCRLGIALGNEALYNPLVYGILRRVMEETGPALIRKHGFSVVEQSEHVKDLIGRFRNRDLGDTCFRLARDPIRKLAPDDRLVGAARLCEQQGIEPVALSRVIAAALRFDSPEDPHAVNLQRRIGEEGIESILRSVCGLDEEEPLGKSVLKNYRALAEGGLPAAWAESYARGSAADASFESEAAHSG